MATNNGPTITLDEMSLIDIHDGGYRIRTHPQPAQNGYTILLEVGRFGPWVDITNGYTYDHMASLLKAAAEYMWGSVIQCRALLVDTSPGPHQARFRVFDPNGDSDVSGTIVAQSQVRDMQTPVQPIEGPLAFGRNLLVQLGHMVPVLRYVGLPGGPNGFTGKGRVLYTTPINNRYYFTRNYQGVTDGPDTDVPVDPTPTGHFTVDPMQRGLDCTTYPLVAFNVAYEYSLPPNQFGDGSKVAQILNATTCDMEDKTGAQLKTFFENNERGDFVMWITLHHCVMVLAGFVHEFSPRNLGHGYCCTNVQQWLDRHVNTPHMNVRALQGTVVNPPVQGGAAPGPVGSIGGPKTGNGQPGNGGSNGGNGSGNGGTTYTVVSGDSLSLIAGRFWGDVLLWPILYDANRAVVGPNPNLIKPGQRLTVPSISGYTQAQLSAARQRGKSC